MREYCSGTPDTSFEIAETISEDIVVCGGGHAGTQCALAAAESGAAVVVLESKREERMHWFGEQVATFNSEFLIQKGFGPYDTDEIIDEFCRCAEWRVSRGLVAKYVKNSGEMLDHMVSLVAADDDLLADDQCNVQEAYGKPQYPITYGGTKSWAGTLQFRGPLVTERGLHFDINERSRLPELEMYALRRSRELGADWRFQQKVVALIKEDGRVIGAVAQGADKLYREFIGRRGVVLTVGSFGKNNMQLGVAAGGHLENTPRHEPLPSMIWNGAGTAPFLMLNRHGKRFCDESKTFGIGAAIDRQPAGTVCCVTDRKYMQTIRLCGLQHGNPDFGMQAFVDQFCEDMSHVIEHGAEGYDVRNLGLTERDPARYWAANTLEELADFLGYAGADKESFLASIRWYNEMCYARYDADFNKDRETLIPIDEAPFYAAAEPNPRRCEKKVTWELTPPISLDASDDFEVYDADNEPIPGFYVAGNTLGNRFGLMYSTPCGGWNIGMAMTYGRLLGKQLSEK